MDYTYRSMVNDDLYCITCIVFFSKSYLYINVPNNLY